jgi:hypothetical protein
MHSFSAAVNGAAVIIASVTAAIATAALLCDPRLLGLLSHHAILFSTQSDLSARSCSRTTARVRMTSRLVPTAL